MIWRRLSLLLLVGMGLLGTTLAAQENLTDVAVHVVQRGENLFRIALQYGLSTNELAEYNGISDPGNIQVGQRLLIPVDPTSNGVQGVVHVVQAGETLRSIADSYNKTVEELAALNQLTDLNSIYVGQVLIIISDAPSAAPLVASPVPTIVPELASVPISVIHIVQSGESLFRIATSYGLTVNELTRANGINDPTLIYAGQQLIIPGVNPPHLALDLPASVSGFDVAPLVLMEGNTGRFRLNTLAPANITGNFLGRPLSIATQEGNTQDIIFVGVPIGTLAGIYPINLTIAEASGAVTNFSVNIQVVSGGYGVQYITLPAEKIPLLDPVIEDNEIALLERLTSTFNPERYFDGPMGLPAAAAMNAAFGMLRSYNGGALDSFHYGADFAGAPGSPVMASAAGRVVFADTLAIRGAVTVIDHGWGIYSTYSHQSERYVQAGDFVTNGQVIGAVGASGRATGAHLHWEVWVNGVPVDPLQWVSQLFS